MSPSGTRRPGGSVIGTHSYEKYPPNHTFGGAKTLNVGCGFSQYAAPNVVNLDAFDVCKPNVVHDLNKTPFPFEDDTFDFILANHVVEHIDRWWEAFNEMARILKPGGRIEIWVPGSGSDTVRGFRDHVHEINNCSFYGVFGTYRQGGNAWAVDQAMCHANRLVQLEVHCRLKKAWWLQRAPQWLKTWFSEHLRNVNIEMGYRFEKVGVEAHKKEMEKFNERAKRNHSLSV